MGGSKRGGFGHSITGTKRIARDRGAASFDLRRGRRRHAEPGDVDCEIYAVHIPENRVAVRPPTHTPRLS